MHAFAASSDGYALRFGLEPFVERGRCDDLGSLDVDDRDDRRVGQGEFCVAVHHALFGESSV